MATSHQPSRGCSPTFASTFYSRRRRSDSPMQGHQRPRGCGLGSWTTSRTLQAISGGLLLSLAPVRAHAGLQLGATSSGCWPQGQAGPNKCHRASQPVGTGPAGVHSHNPPPQNISLQNLRGSTHLRSSGKKSSAPQMRRLTWGPACRSRCTVELRRESWDTPVPEKRSPRWVAQKLRLP